MKPSTKLNTPEGTEHSIASYTHVAERARRACITFDVIHDSADGVNKVCGWCGAPVKVVSRKVFRVVNGQWVEQP